MLNMRKVELELISDANMNLFFKISIKGGVLTFVRVIVKPATSI